jgi:hypothetical protein
MIMKYPALKTVQSEGFNGNIRGLTGYDLSHKFPTMCGAQIRAAFTTRGVKMLP